MSIADIASLPNPAEPAPEPETTPSKWSRNSRPVQIAWSITTWTLFVVLVALIWPVRFGGFTGITVVGGQSMEPTLYIGDLVVTWKHAPYQVGDVIVYTRPEGEFGGGIDIIHRIVQVIPGPNGEPSGYRTKGDNPKNNIDSWTVHPQDVKGKMMFQAPRLGGPLRFLLSPIGILVMCAAIVGWAVYKLVMGWNDEDDTPPQPNAP